MNNDKIKRLSAQVCIALGSLFIAHSASAMDCSMLPQYEKQTYAAGDNVQHTGQAFTCTVGGWCSTGGPYEPNVGWAWQSAWTALGECDDAGLEPEPEPEPEPDTGDHGVCAGINVYPNWTRTDWQGKPSHATRGDQMQHLGKVYEANWYTSSLPGSDGAWTFVKACPKDPDTGGGDNNIADSANHALMHIIPHSQVPFVGHSEYVTSHDYQYQGNVWAAGLDESRVFHRQLSHQGDGQPWTLRIGKGGQIYSMKSAFGEIVPPQYHHDAVWIDEVWQTVSVDQSADTAANGKYFIHQAGVYLRDDSLAETFYSPMLADTQDDKTRTYSVINWGQHAHIPTHYQSGAIYYNQYKDLGEGVIEVNAGVYNAGKDTLDFFNFPWGGVRRSTLEYDIRTRTDGSYYQANQRFAESDVNVYNKTAGWSGFSADKSGKGESLAVVFGYDQRPLPQWQKGQSSWRSGYAGRQLADERPVGVSDLEWRNYLVSSARRRFDLQPGLGVWVRYYYVMADTMDLAKQVIDQRGLVQAATYSLMDYQETTSALIPWYMDENSEHIFSDKPQGENGTVAFYTFAQPVSGSKALFLMQDAKGVTRVSTNPYAFAEQNKPYDGNTASWQLMGYVLPKGSESGEMSYAELAPAIDEYLVPTGDVLLTPKEK